MAPLHATVALPALTDVDLKRADKRALHRQLFLILSRHPHVAQGARTPRTLRRQGGLIRLIDVRRRPAMGAPAIARSGSPAGSAGYRDARPARKRRGLARDRAPRGLQFVFQFLVLAPQSLPLGFRPPQVFLELHDTSRLIVDDLLGVTRGRGIIALRHAPVMPDSQDEYKRKPQGLAASVCRDKRGRRVSALLTR